MKNSANAVFVLFIVAFLIPACGGVSGSFIELEDTAWELIEIQGEPILDGTYPDIRFEGGRIFGNGSCNNFGGDYSQTGHSITIGMLMSTLMACESVEVMDQEQEYLSLLQNSVEFSHEDGRLSFHNAEGIILLSFIKMDTSLEGKTWQLIAYDNGLGEFIPIIEGSSITGQFTAGTVSGSAGCNHYGASYTFSEDGFLQIEPTSITEMYCEQPAGVMEQEFLYLQVLSRTSSYRVERSQLTLLGDDGLILAQLTLLP